MREPLLHFFVLGGLIFAVNAIVTPSVSKDRLIEVTPEVRQSIIDTFKDANKREPTGDELDPLIDLWILNEITYREALAQGLDKGDEMIRERIMQKMRLLVFGNVKVNDPTEADLRDWLEVRRARFDVPEIASFYAVTFTGADAEANARKVLQQIETGTEPEQVRQRAIPFVNRPRPGLEATFGKAFVEGLTSLPIGEWRMLPSSAGWHIVRVDKVVPGRAVDLAEVSPQLVADWRAEQVRRIAVSTIRDMGKSYVIRR